MANKDFISRINAEINGLNQLFTEESVEQNQLISKFQLLSRYIIELASEKSGVLSNLEIMEGLESGLINIHPFVPEHVNTSSYDVTLGRYFWRTDRSSHDVFLNPFDEERVLKYFGSEHREAIKHSDWLEQHDRKPFKNIPLDHEIIVLAPGERILAHTHEFIGIGPPGTSSMQARSTWGRLGIQVCEDAGWGDSGYKNRWTMEIHNGNENVHVPLPVGERIGQLVFYHTGEVDGDYSSDTGKYQDWKDDFEAGIKSWSPYDMLPRAHKDQRRKPLEI